LSCLLIPISIFSQKIVVVEVGKGWVNTGVNLAQGESINILSRGAATAALNNPLVYQLTRWWGTPDGEGGNTNWKTSDNISNEYFASGFPSMALVGKMGSGGSAFLVGSSLGENSPKTGTLYLAITSNVVHPEGNFGFYISVIFTKSTLTKASQNPELAPSSLSLQQNFPNPFNPETQIEYTLNERSLATLKIYNSLGQEVKTLVDGVNEPGTYSIMWDGTDNTNQPVMSGQYYYQVSQGREYTAKKAILVR
jgi:hypothetical protein